MTASATTPSRTLARLSFRVVPERMGEFEAAYKAKLTPILQAHGLLASSERRRETLANIFSRLFEMKKPSDVEEKVKALRQDTAWQEALRELGVVFGTAGLDGLAIHRFGVYSAPAGPGETLPAISKTGHWRTFGVADGLAGMSVVAIYQDRDGNLWFGGSGGASRYDGKTFKIFAEKDGLGSNSVLVIYQDRDGDLWFGTGEGGVSRYDGRTFTTFTTKDGLAGNEVRAILQDQDGNLWFGSGFITSSGGGVSRYDGKTFTTFTTKDGLVHNTVCSLFQDRDGNLWFGTHAALGSGQGGGVSRYDGKTFTVFTVRDGLVSNSALSILQDRDGNLWFSGFLGASRYDGKTFTGYNMIVEGGARQPVYSAIQDRRGNLWFAVYGGGVSRYDRERFTAFTEKDGLAGNEVYAAFEDREGHLWFAGQAGVSRYDPDTLTTFALEGNRGRGREKLFQDREGNIWFSSASRGLGRYDREGRRSGEPSGTGTFIFFTTKDGLASNQVRSLFQDRDGCFWFGTNDGLSRYDGRTFTTYTAADGLGGNLPTAILQDLEGRLWVGDRGGGITRYDGQSFVTFTTNDGLGHNWVYCILEDRQGQLWCGTRAGMSRYDPSKRSGQCFTTFTTKDGLPHNTVLGMFQDREGVLWIGTHGGGVSRYDGKEFITFTTRDGLAGNEVSEIFQDREGHLWFGTTGGISRYDGQVFQTINEQDGLVDNDVGSIVQDREGVLWFRTIKGIIRYHSPRPSPPPVFIDAVIADRRYEGVAEIEVPSFVNLIVFEFHGISFKTRPEQMVYRYRLKGHEEAWRNTRERRVEYQDLPAGTYRFEVLAVDRDLVYSERPATVQLTIVQDPRDRQIDELEQRVRERTWELQEANKALSDANRALFEANVRIQEATQRKSRFLASMSHELRTPMNAIMGFTNLVLRRRSENLTERQRDNLVKVRQSADDLLDLINDLLDLSKIEAGRMEVRKVRFEVRGLIASCCETVGLLVKPGVSLVSEIADDVGTAETDEAKVRQIIINLLSNALKFTEKGEVKVRVASLRSRVESRGFSPELATRDQGPGAEGDRVMEIAVSDTGIGIPAEAMDCIFEEFRQVEGESRREKGTGLGLSITKKLTELLGGTIGVESEAGKGSTFTVRLPITYRAT